jgi:hydroxymethylpyrimidine pyrophosphatase-like HAD family hydrolase
MADAHPAVLRVADEIAAPAAEDGVAQILERWF